MSWTDFTLEYRPDSAFTQTFHIRSEISSFWICLDNLDTDIDDFFNLNFDDCSSLLLCCELFVPVCLVLEISLEDWELNSCSTDSSITSWESSVSAESKQDSMGLIESAILLQHFFSNSFIYWRRQISLFTVIHNYRQGVNHGTSDQELYIRLVDVKLLEKLWGQQSIPLINLPYHHSDQFCLEWLDII